MVLAIFHQHYTPQGSSENRAGFKGLPDKLNPYRQLTAPNLYRPRYKSTAYQICKIKGPFRKKN